jgi:hypothetical protein
MDFFQLFSPRNEKIIDVDGEHEIVQILIGLDLTRNEGTYHIQELCDGPLPLDSIVIVEIELPAKIVARLFHTPDGAGEAESLPDGPDEVKNAIAEPGDFKGMEQQI